MGRDGDKKGRWSIKSLLNPGLRHRSFRDARGARGASLASLSPEPESPAPAAALGAPATPPSTSPGVQQSSDAGDSGQGSAAISGSAAAAAAAHPLAGRSLVVQVLQARRLRAADSNGLSDPYCVVKVGEHKASSKTELKTLEPRWNETMCFSAANVAEALEDGRPFVAFRVFDWDLVSADDFLGQCEVAFDSLDASLAGPSPPRWLPLYGYARAGRKVDAGEIQVAAWFEAGGGQGHQDGGALSTLCCPPGTRKQVPQVVHSQRGILYEEPLIACLAVTLDRVEGLGAHPAAAAAGQGASSTNGFSDAGSPLARGSASPLAPWRGDSPVAGSGGKLLGRLFNRKHGGGGGGGGGAARILTNSSSMRSSVSDGMIAGEDPGDEYGGLDFYEREAGMGGEAEYGLGVEEDEEVPQELLQEDPATPRGTGRDSTDEGQLARSSVLARPPTFLSRDEGHHALSGMRMYVRLVLGRQKQTSWIKKEHANGAANWHQTFVFATPLPLRDRQLRVELYRTSSSTQRGRLISIAHVWVHALVPPALAQNQETCRQSTVELESVLKHQPGGRVLLRSTLVDTDLRRCMYQAPFLDGEEPEEQQQHAAAEGAGGAGRRVQRLESLTLEYSNRELKKKVMHSEQSFKTWEDSHRHRAKAALKGYATAGAELAQYGWQRISRYMSSDQEVPTGDAAAAPGGAPALAPGPPKLPEPVGTLQLTVHSISLPAASNSDCYFVLKCGPHWGRSKQLAMGGRTSVECGWQLSLPVLDPSHILTIALFQPSRGLKATERLRPGFLPPAAGVVVVGKLRVRLSCLRPNTPLSADLVLLGERARGAHEAGTVKLSLETSYPSPLALFKGYAAPRLPRAAYAHGVDAKAHQAVMARECRRIVLRWLDGANPSIGSAEALTVLDAEREVFAMSRARVNYRRIRMALVGLRRVQRKFEAIKTWQEPWESVAAMAAIVVLCFAPRVAVPLVLAWVVAGTLAVQPEFEEGALRMEQDPPDIEPENESLETTTVNPLVNLRAKVDRLTRMGLLVQNVLDDVASAMERAGALLSWQDPSATLGVLGVLTAVALLIFFLGLSTVVAFALCFVIRPPALRTPTPPLPAVVFGKLPTRGDRIV